MAESRHACHGWHVSTSEDAPATSRIRSVVVIAASAGGLQAISTILEALPPDFPAPIVIVLHRSPGYELLLPSIFKRRTVLPVIAAAAGETVVPGNVYVANADRHLMLDREGRFTYVDGRRIRHVFSSANPLFASAADVCGPGAIGVVLTGTGQDGTDGVQAISERGGAVIAQNRATSRCFGMPDSAIGTGAVDYVLPLEGIAPALVRLARERSGQPAAITGPPGDVQPG